MKKKILISYIGMLLGGSTTALLSMLNEFDYDKYEVDLALYYNNLPFDGYIPKQVNVISPCRKWGNSLTGKLAKYTRYLFSKYWLLRIYYILKYKDKRAGTYAHHLFQLRCNTKWSTDKQYDVAIGYMEGWSDQFIAERVKAKKKIMWLHLDLKNVAYVNIDQFTDYMQHADDIVCVSQECLNNFRELFPHLAEKATYLPNLTSAAYIQSRAEQQPEDSDYQLMDSYRGFKIVSTCRLSIYHKGIDRMIRAAAKMKEQKLDFKWFVLGEGEDRAQIEKMIAENHLSDCFLLLGAKINPYAYTKRCDVFCLPSRYEGKPMAITETMMLGVAPVVTEYASAREQIEDGVTGIITENNDSSIADALIGLYHDTDRLSHIKATLVSRDFSNTQEIEKVFEILK